MTAKKVFTLEQFRQWGAKGGAAKSKAKAKAARANGKKPKKKKEAPDDPQTKVLRMRKTGTVPRVLK